MKMPAKVVGRVLATLFAAAITFCGVLAITERAYVRWYLPRMMNDSTLKHSTLYVHVAIRIFGPISLGAWVCALLVIILGTRWTLKSARQSTFSPDRTA